uniref:G_PROTEIN_RECEP_F1_2 domain-containing protein n=1 Tax=Caenorhabditis japonica TaxID=281687 RepID=A0A8R1HT63_CAEJA
MNLTVLAELIEARARAETELLCAHYETYTPVRFGLITIATVIAALGTIGNILLLIVFSSKQISNTPATLYPSVLACLDFSICFEYILLFGVDALVSYLKIESLFTLYYLYIVPAYVMARITQLAIPYMLIFATLERLFWTSKNKSNLLKAFHSTTGRHVTIIVSLVLCVILRSPSAFAIMVDEYPNCPDFFRTKTTNQREWAQESIAYHFFDFQVMTIAQTLVPFILLVGLNLIIVRRMCSDNVQKEKEPEPTEVCFKENRLLTQITPVHKSSTTIGLSFPPLKSMSPAVRSAVFTMAAIVTSYLISNVLHLILTVLERSGHQILKSDEDPLMSSQFHTFFSDVVSFVYMFTSAIRIVIYYLCNPKIRGDLVDFFANRKNAVYL